MNTQEPPADVDTYLESFDDVVRMRLESVRNVIRDTAPEASEQINYGLVGYKLHGRPLVYFGGYPNHVGFYATPNGHDAFRAEFAPYKQGKGSVQFPHDKPLPLDLIKRVVQYRAKLD